MGLFSTLVGWDQFKEAFNAVCANHLLANATPELKHKITLKIVEIMREVRRSGTPEELLTSLAENSRSVQMQFVMEACRRLGIPPSIPGESWNPIKNPYHANWVKERHVQTAIEMVRDKQGVQIHWPGDEVAVDFVKLYRGVAAAGC